MNVIFPKTLYQNRKLRVAAYVRVSTASDDQLLSLKAQTEHYRTYIESNENWMFSGVYSDEGVSGTQLKKRNGLNRLIEDCEKGLVELIITKSISRFARNTEDCLKIVRKLLTYDVPIIFEKENIRTDDMESELILSILAELAASESRNISENEKWGIQKRFKDGTYIISYPPYGYRNNKGVMEIIPEEARVVKEIFDKTLQGYSSESIADLLNKQHITTKRNQKWSPGTVRGIIKNEKYIGDVLFQKTFTDDNYIRHKNNGQKTSYYMENHHEAIISKETYHKANFLIQQRKLEKGNCGKASKFQNRYSFSGKIICGECGDTFKRRIHTMPKRKYIAWCCATHINDKHICGMKYIEEERIKYASIMMFNKLIYGKTFILKPLQDVFTENSNNYLKEKTQKILEIDKKMEEINHLYHSGYLTHMMYQNVHTKLVYEKEKLLKQVQQTKKCEMHKAVCDTSLKNLIKRLNKLEYLTTFSETLFTDFVEKIEIVSREKIRFLLKCGLELEERLN